MDPGFSSGATLYANGVHLADVSGRLLVKNISTAPISVSGQVYPLASNRSATSVGILPKSLAPGEAAELEVLTQSKLKLEGAAIRLDGSGGAGSIIATFSSMEAHGVIRSVPFVGASDYRTLTGGYPWRIDTDYTSKIFITNFGGSRAAIAAWIRTDNSDDYDLGTTYLEPGESKVFNVREIRDRKIPDRKHRQFPANKTTGQFDWSSVLNDGTERLVGREEISSLSAGSVTPLTVYNCNCPLSAYSAFIDPVDPFAPIGGQTSALAEIEYQNVCTWARSYVGFAALSWSIDSPPILSLTTGVTPSTMRGLSAGYSGFATVYNGRQWHFSPSNGCTSTFVQLKPRATGSVGPYKVEPLPNSGSQGPFSCPVGQAGWYRNVYNQVQYYNGKPYAFAGLSVSDTISISTPNALGITGTKTGTDVTTGDGSFPDRYDVCSSACPTSVGETDAYQGWKVNGQSLPHANSIIYKCNSIKIDGN